MRIVRTTMELPKPPPNIVATIGNFDGVHVGHQTIIRALKQKAQELHGVAAVITFQPHPLKLLRPDNPPRLVTPYGRRDRLIQHCGADLLIVLQFDEGFAAIEAEEFIEDYLWGWLGVRHMIMGFNSHFGRARKGNYDSLVEAGQSFGFQVSRIDPVVVKGQPVSSSRIRRLLDEGDVSLASELLGRPHSIEGRVVKGDGRGKQLGIPTANINPHGEIVPANGVYCGRFVSSGQVHQAVVNIGTKPTFDQVRRTTEVHVLDFEGDLYGCAVELFFDARLRDERRFDSPKALVEQIHRDIEKSRRILADVAALALLA